jgi:lipopolysaccharide transport system ATP-binding protein
MDSILAFADIGEFVNRPIKTYSSGMIMRLAFAVQAQVEPDILIVDEALAVGDAKFQSKCFARLDVLKESGTSILFVSHSTEQVVSHCDRAVLLHEGRVHETGRPKDVVHTYLDLLFGGSRTSPAAAAPIGVEEVSQTASADVPDTVGNRSATRPGYNPYEYRWGDGAACIADYCLRGLQGSNSTVIRTGTKVSLSLGVSFLRDVQRPILGLTIKTKDGITVYGVNTEIATAPNLSISGLAGTHARVNFDFDCRLGPGDYFVSVGIASRDGEDVIPHDRRYDSIHLNVVGTGFFGLTQLDMGIDALEISQ